MAFLRRTYSSGMNIINQEQEHQHHQLDEPHQAIMFEDGYSGNHSATPSSNSYPSYTTATTIRSDEIWKSMANRILHSTQYKAFYVSMAVLSLCCLLISLVQQCPATWFYILEALIILSMIIEVAIRGLAVGKRFWGSIWNVGDVCLVVFCFITFLLVLIHPCGAERTSEVMAEDVVLIIRNGLQLFRVGVLMQKNRTSLSKKPQSINLHSVSGIDSSLMVPMVNDTLSFQRQSDYDYFNDNEF